jgi:hypothetical protein
MEDLDAMPQKKKSCLSSDVCMYIWIHWWGYVCWVKFGEQLVLLHAFLYVLI